MMDKYRLMCILLTAKYLEPDKCTVSYKEDRPLSRAILVRFHVHQYKFNADSQYIKGARLFIFPALVFSHMDLYVSKTRQLQGNKCMYPMSYTYLM